MMVDFAGLATRGHNVHYENLTARFQLCPNEGVQTMDTSIDHSTTGRYLCVSLAIVTAIE